MKTILYPKTISVQIRTMFFIALAAIIFSLQNCTVIYPGQVAVVTRYGKVNRDLWEPGMHGHRLFGVKVNRFSTRIIDYSDNIHLPSKEGLEVIAEVTMLYHIKPESVKDIYLKLGPYYQTLVKNNFMASLREIFVLHYAKDIITQRAEIEKSVTEKVESIVKPYGIEIDQVLLKDIDLPQEFLQAIKNKVTSEQLAQQTKFELDRQRQEFDFEIEKQKKNADFSIEKQKKEAERMQIDAEAIKKYQETINASITDKLIQYKGLEITKGLVTSPNSKVIITDGKSQLFLGTGPDAKN